MANSLFDLFSSWVALHADNDSYSARTYALKQYQDLPLIQGIWKPLIPDELWKGCIYKPYLAMPQVDTTVMLSQIGVGQQHATQYDALIAALYNRYQFIILRDAEMTLELTDVSYAIDKLIIIVPTGVCTHLRLVSKSAHLTLKHITYHVEPSASLTVTTHFMGSSQLYYCAQEWYISEQAIVSVQEVYALSGLCILPKQYHLLGRQAKVTAVSYGAVGNQDRYFLTTKQHHQAPETHSSVSVRSTVDGMGYMSYEGSIMIGSEAAGSSAQQQCKALMLSQKAVCLAQPCLEILTDDVQCAHGCAAGYVNEEHIWSLRARGLSDEMVRTLLIEGFYLSDVPLADSSRVLLKDKHETHRG